MAEVINKSEIVRRLHDRGMTYPQIAKATGIRYNMVYNIIDRYKAQEDYKEPKTLIPDKKEVKELEGLVTIVLLDMCIVWDDKAKSFQKLVDQNDSSKEGDPK